jgi:hypothetical protein
VRRNHRSWFLPLLVIVPLSILSVRFPQYAVLRILLVGGAGASLYFVVRNYPSWRRLMEARLDPVGLRRQRLWLIYGVMVLILGGALYNISTDTEHWPFSPYSMYASGERYRSLEILRVYGVTAGDAPGEIPLWQPPYLHPFDNSRLRGALTSMQRNAGRRHRIPDAPEDILARYEQLRQGGRHHGVPLRGIRLYWLSWKLDPWARNADQPDLRELLFEVVPPVGKEL